MKGNKRLRSMILGQYDTIGEFAKAINMSLPSLSQKLNCITKWQQDDVKTIVKALDSGAEIAGAEIVNNTSIQIK